MPAAGLKVPEAFAAVRVEREEVSLGVSAEQNVARRDQERSQKPRGGREGPLLFTGDRIVGGDVSLNVTAVRPFENPIAADERLALDRLFITRRQLIADLLHWNVEQSGAKRISGLIPVLGADGARAHELGFTDLRLDAPDELTRFGNSANPIHVFGEAPCLQELAGSAVQHEYIAGLVGLHHDLTGGSVDGKVGEHEFERRIIIPHVLWNFLIVPFQFAGSRIECDYAAGIKIVSAPVARVQIGGGIAYAPI